jgi:hypothetical protein
MATQHTVQEGDCISNIAAQYGIPWKKVWNHGDNAQLKALRKDPGVLFPGDVVMVPDMEPRDEMRGTDARHKFKKKVEPTHLKIRLLIDDQPRANVKYELQVDGNSISGSTDSDGYLEQKIPANAAQGTLIAGTGTSRTVYALTFGTLDPIDTDEGVRRRLLMLGYDADPDLADAVRGFQTKEHMTVTGTVDDALRARLKERFGQ